VLSVGLRDILAINSTIGEDVVYEITRVLHNNLEALRSIHPSIKDLSFNGYKNSLVPLHPGAAKFYKEKGIPIQ